MHMASFDIRDSDNATALSLLQNVHAGPGTLPAFYSLDSGFFFSGVKRPGHEADHAPPSSAEDQNE
jgi:hypothetical protein